MFHYLKYTLYLLLAVPVLGATTLGGHWMWYGLLAAIFLIVIGDIFMGDDVTEPKFHHPGVLNFQLFLSLPVTAFYCFVMVWHASSGTSDPLGYGAFVQSVSGFDAIAARNATTPFDYVGGFITAALYVTLMSTLVAHELTHRTWDKAAMFVGRWLLAFSWDVGFATEHVYGHHVYVGTTKDPATAPRGRNVYTQIVLATIRTNVSAWNLEKERLVKKRLPVFSHHNAFLRGQLMSLSIAVASFLVSGWKGVLFFLGMAAGAKVILEIVNYMEHYGVVRLEGQPVQPRHSWNSNKRMSSWATFNLTRHSHHHAQGEVPFWDLRPYQDAPMMVSGYLSTIFLTLVPPLWHRLMVPKLIEWDQRYASPEEKKLAGIANAESGLSGLVEHTYGARGAGNAAPGAALPA
ncbi:MAG: alkane 1-monooxygenase [Polyangiales bacterium]